jgi:hypothetical protein
MAPGGTEETSVATLGGTETPPVCFMATQGYQEGGAGESFPAPP